MSRPYADAALDYLSKGWAPIPLPYKRKSTPPTGWTGYAAPYPSGADVAEWSNNGSGGGNVALRLPQNVIGIDVDTYGQKRGATTLAAAEARNGQLPPTWRSTSRSGGLDGIYLYRVPEGRRWADTLGPDVEIIHYGHRYLVAAPSAHPDHDEPYRWLDPQGREGSMPHVSDLPELPEKWRAELDTGSIHDVSQKATLMDDEVAEWLAALPGTEPCPYLDRLLENAASTLQTSGSRHDTGRGMALRVVRAGEQGHHGAGTALDTLHGLWVDALQQGESRKPDHGEWERMVAGAVAIVVKDPTAEADLGCCGGVVLQSVEDFWSERETLQHIHTFARARMTSPWAVLGVVLARTVTAVPPWVVLPATVGGYGSLNLFVALTGPSGMGKGAAESAAEDCIDFKEPIETVTVGSGEGIPHLYAHREKGDVVRDRDAVMFTIPEVDNLVALGNRQGATLLPQLRVAWSGEKLGFSYADPTKRLPIDKHTYRMGLVLGVQPGRAAPLLEDADGGTPQRFVWLPTTDPGAPDDLPECPEPRKWSWSPGTLFANGAGLVVLSIPDVARTTIMEARRAKLRGEGDALDGHALLARLKLAAALGLLEGRQKVTEDDWRLAGIVMDVSDATRGGVQKHLAAEYARANQAKAQAEGERVVIVSEKVEAAQKARVARLIDRVIGAEDDWVSKRKIQHAAASRDRKAVAAALEALVESGRIEVSDDGKYRRVR